MLRVAIVAALLAGLAAPARAAYPFGNPPDPLIGEESFCAMLTTVIGIGVADLRRGVDLDAAMQAIAGRPNVEWWTKFYPWPIAAGQLRLVYGRPDLYRDEEDMLVKLSLGRCW